MPVPATTGQLRTKIEDMEIGDYIPYTYKVTTKGKSGRITEIGASTHSEIPVTGMEVGKGTAYLTKVARGLLCSDRVVQYNISWDELNASKVIQGNTYYLYESVDNGSLNDDTSKNAYYPAPIVFNHELYITWNEHKGTASQIRVKKFYLIGFVRSLGGGCAYLDRDGKSSLIDKGLGAGRDDVWYWNGVVAWMQDTPITSIRQSSARTCRGYSSVDTFHDNLTNITVAHLGFRPVFEYQE